MVKTSVEQVESALAHGVKLSSRLGIVENDEGIDAFNMLRLGVMQVSRFDDTTRDALLRNLDPKTQVLEFLIGFHLKKRTYRRQVASVLAILLQSESWFKALHDDACLCSRLPVELRVADPQIADASVHVQAFEQLQSPQCLSLDQHALLETQCTSGLQSQLLDQKDPCAPEQHCSPPRRLKHPPPLDPLPSDSPQQPLQHAVQALISEHPVELKLQSNYTVSEHSPQSQAESHTCTQEHHVVWEDVKPRGSLQLPQRPSHPPPVQALPSNLQVPTLPQVASTHGVASKPHRGSLKLSEVLSCDTQVADLRTSEKDEWQHLPDFLPLAEHQLQFTPHHTPCASFVSSPVHVPKAAPKGRPARPSMVKRLWELMRGISSAGSSAHDDIVSAKPSTPGVQSSIAPTDHEVRAAVKAAQEHAAARIAAPNSHTQFREEPAVELEKAMALMQKCRHSTDFDNQVAAFQAFQRFVCRVSSTAYDNKDNSVEKLVREIQSKGFVLRFLVDVHEQRKVQRKRVCSTLKCLLRFHPWQLALMADTDLCTRLPPDLQLLAQSHNLLPVPTAVEDLLKKSLNEMDKISYRASQQSASVAFETFQAGVLHIVDTLPDSYVNVLGLLEPKAKILEFIVDFHDLDRQNRRATRSLLGRLVSLQAWKQVIEADSPLQAKVSTVMQDLSSRGPPAPPDVAERCCSRSPTKKKKRPEALTPKSSSDQRIGADGHEDLGCPSQSHGSWYSRAIAFMTGQKESA